MPGPHTEENLQAHVAEQMVAHGGWSQRPASDVDKATRLIPDDLFAFLAATQPKAVETLKERIGEEKWQQRVIDVVARELDRGPGEVLTLFRREKGKQIEGVWVRFCFFRPTHGLNPENVERYEQNILTVVREAPVRKPDGTWGEVDLALFVNGIPVADAEAKNPLSGTTVRDAIRQYRYDRDPADTLLSRRSVVHFAFDTDLVRMATTLSGGDTRFLPFDRGSEPDGLGGAGNYLDRELGPYPTSYLWRLVWQRDNWLDLLNRFVHVSPVDPSDPASKPSMIFPRHHQWDCVRRIEAHTRVHGAGHNYLTEHSAGSGKSNTISWLAHRLATLHDDADERVFDKVVVVTDRRVLDDQLQATVAQFERASAKGMVRVIDRDSAQLAEALESPSAKIVVTTLQKFPFVLDKVGALAGSRFAVLIDEAHSSQSGESAKKMKQVLTARTLEEAAEQEAADDTTLEDTVEDAVEASARARGRPKNVSMFAFTATPKARTRELFGTPEEDPDGVVRYRRFHLYSMRQAIEEAFILDVLRNYTTYATFWKIATAAGDELVRRSKAAVAAARYATLHPHVVDQKVEIIVEHFREHVAGKIGGRAKAMIVTRSRLHAVRYKQAVDRYLAAHAGQPGYDGLAALVAFSGKVADPDLPGTDDFSEAGMNGFPESQTARRFDTDDYQVLIVAEKFQTGFDQPLLHTMYIDKPLKDVAAVQTLGRLNRIHPDKDDTFVLDFVNDAADIQAAFEPFYAGAAAVATDPQTLYDTWQRISDYHVVDDEEIDEFARVSFTAAPGDTSVHGHLNELLEPARARFADLAEGEQEDFRKTLKQFIRLYAFLAQVLDYTNTDLEKAHAYAKLLSRRIAPDRETGYDLSDRLQLTHVRLVERGSVDIGLVAEEHDVYAFPGEGAGPLTEDEQVLLGEVVTLLNEKYGANLTDADKVFLQSVGERLADEEAVQQAAVANPEPGGNFKYAVDDVFIDVVLAAMERDTELGKQLLDNDAFSGVVKSWLVKYVHRRAQQKRAQPELPLGPEAAPS